jgi:hypothetical protein
LAPLLLMWQQKLLGRRFAPYPAQERLSTEAPGEVWTGVLAGPPQR